MYLSQDEVTKPDENCRDHRVSSEILKQFTIFAKSGMNSVTFLAITS
jgi:hypothetical protein